jgi:hypothetical protein
MRFFFFLTFSLLLLQPLEAGWQKPGRSRTFTFTKLPQTLWSLGQPVENKQAPAVTVQLPTNYTRKQDFPVLVFMGGARGESGHHAILPKSIVGTEDFILVSMPMFKLPEDIENDRPNPNVHPLAITPVQTGLLWSAYEPMLEKVFKEVPNADRTRAFFGGFSNGAHATAALLNDETAGPGLRDYFNHFLFVEGGHFLRLTMSLPDADLLFMQGQHRAPWLEKVAEPLQWNVRIGVEVRTMPGMGHAFPPSEKRWLENWIRRKSGLLEK